MYIVDSLCNVHSHLREGAAIQQDLVWLAAEGGADHLLPMPNTDAGLLTAQQVISYHVGLRAVQAQERTKFIKTVYLNEQTRLDMIDECVDSGIIDGKAYPRDRTTKSQNGFRRPAFLLKLAKHAGRRGMKIHLHPEHPNLLFDNREAEWMFVPLVEMLLQETEATIIWEHGTDARCIPFWKEFAESGRFFLTLTAHHLVTSEDESFGDVRAICKPPLKTRRDRVDLVRLISEGHQWIMAGLDDAPHDSSTKHPAKDGCSCGAYTAPFGLQLYAHALHGMLAMKQNGLQIFNAFVSRNARRLHDLPDTSREYRLVKKPFRIPYWYQVGNWQVQSFWAGREIDYSIEPLARAA